MGTSDRPLKLHLGSGDKYWPGFVNLDKYSSRADVHCEGTHLPHQPNTADELHAIHLLEHFHRLEAENALREWYRVLKPKGKLVLELPSLDKMAQRIVNGETNLRFTLLGLYGDPRETKPGMAHQWGWSMKELEMVLSDVGFVDVSLMEPKFHFPERDMRVEAVKP